MPTSTDWKVYYRRVGESKKRMAAQFADRTDAINWAAQFSRNISQRPEYEQGQYSVSLICFGQVQYRFVEGRMVYIK